MSDRNDFPVRRIKNVVFPIFAAIFYGFLFHNVASAQGLASLIHGDAQVDDPIDAKAQIMAGLQIFHDGFESPVTPVTYTEDVQPILGSKCAPCHTGAGVGGHDIGTVYSDSFLPAFDPDCPGLNIAECSLVLIQNGNMPQGGGCTGDPVKDAGNPSCLTQLEQDTVQAWIDMGLLE